MPKPTIAMARIFVASLTLLLAIGLAFDAPAQEEIICRCKHHNASARAIGHCSRSEDENFCMLTFVTTNSDIRSELAEWLTYNQRDAYSGEVDEKLPLSLQDAIVELFAQSVQDEEILDAIRSFLTADGGLIAIEEFVSRDRSAPGVSLGASGIFGGGSSLSAASGCLRFNQGDFEAVVRLADTEPTAFCE